jgi:hypothetical protein
LNRIGLIVVLSLAASGRVFPADVSYPDAEVLSSCIGAGAPKAATYGGNRIDGVIYVLPAGEATIGLANEGQVRGELRSANWEALRGPLQNLRNRTSKGWVLPKGISASAFRVEVAESPKGEFGYEHLYFSFWPPGYSADMQSSVVRAFVGPTPHGATITCELSLRNGSWVVVNSWFTPYA